VFQPASVTVRIGTTVAWANIDDREVGCFAVRNPHTVTSDTGLFQGDLAGGLMGTDEVFSYTFTETGIFSYHCELHPGESGTVIVEEALAG
jgi:plastocyanin